MPELVGQLRGRKAGTGLSCSGRAKNWSAGAAVQSAAHEVVESFETPQARRGKSQTIRGYPIGDGGALLNRWSQDLATVKLVVPVKPTAYQSHKVRSAIIQTLHPKPYH